MGNRTKRHSERIKIVQNPTTKEYAICKKEKLKKQSKKVKNKFINPYKILKKIHGFCEFFRKSVNFLQKTQFLRQNYSPFANFKQKLAKIHIFYEFL